MSEDLGCVVGYYQPDKVAITDHFVHYLNGLAISDTVKGFLIVSFDKNLELSTAGLFSVLCSLLKKLEGEERRKADLPVNLFPRRGLEYFLNQLSNSL